MKTPLRLLVAALAAGAALTAALSTAEARPAGAAPAHGGGNWNGGGNWHGGGGWHGGYWGGYRGWYGGWGYRGYWGYPGYAYWPGYYWGVGLATAAYAAPYYNYYGGYYGYPYAYGAPVTQYIVSEPQQGDRVVRSGGQPVPQTPPPDPIFYPRNGQTAAQTEADRQDCNRWATTQAGAMSDAQIFQRATFACMDGRGYSVR